VLQKEQRAYWKQEACSGLPCTQLPVSSTQLWLLVIAHTGGAKLHLVHTPCAFKL